MPSSVLASSSRIISRPRLLKYSELSAGRTPSVSPASAYRNTRSMSDEKLSSRPPSLPMATTISGTSTACALRGLPNVASR